MEKFKQYLGRAGESEKPLRLCLGNVSCDMDSVVGSLALGYYYYLKYNLLFKPAINCSRAFFKMKLEIAMHLADCSLEPFIEKLMFLEDLQGLRDDVESAVEEVALIDHNLLDSS